MEDQSNLIGQVIEIVKGRDAGNIAIVVHQIDERFVYIADGAYRRSEEPKKKNIKHIHLTRYVAEDIREALLQAGRVPNLKIRYALDKYKETITEEQMKGEK